MNGTKYFILNNHEAFAKCSLSGACEVDAGIRPAEGQYSATLQTPVLDSGAKGNVWQRVLADVRLPEGAKIAWRLWASDSQSFASQPHFFAENTLDFIPVGIHGQFLKLEATISGMAEIRSIQVFSSWETFLDYLPEIYRDYNGFTDRFLRLFAAQYLELEHQIDALPNTFDPAVAPPETLFLLAGIVGVAHVKLWDAAGLRRLLCSGIYSRKGQFSLLAEYILYFTGFRPYIVEHFRYVTGQPENDRLLSGYDLTVFLPPEAAVAAVNPEALDLIISDFLPADVRFRVILLDSYPVVSGYSYLGINTRVGAYEQMRVGSTRIGYSIVGKG